MVGGIIKPSQEVEQMDPREAGDQIFACLKIWGFTHRQMQGAIGRLQHLSNTTSPGEWDRMNPFVQSNPAKMLKLPGLQ